MTATVDPGVNVVLDAQETGLPLLFVVEIAPIGGVVALELDGDLVATWNDTQVGVGQTFDVYMSLAQGQSDTIGTVRTSFAYMIQPGYEIDFDEAFHNLADHWGLQAPDVQSYLISGARRGNISPGQGPAPEVFFEESEMLRAAVDSLFLLADTYAFTQQRVDTLPLNYTFEPYPCVRASVSGNLFTYLQYDVSIDDLCARYAPPSDTLCWSSTEPLACLTAASGQITFANIPVPCEAVKDFVVPICPIKASGSANVSIRSEIVLNNLELHYTCNPPGPLEKGDLDPIVNLSPVTSDSTWLVESAISFETDRDDAIFAVPVPLDSVTVTLSEGGVPLDPNDIVNDGGSYSIDWALDNRLKQCCAGDEEVKIVYRGADVADPASACSEVIAVLTDSGTHTWAPSVGCAPAGIQKFVVITEFSCSGTGAILYRARSDTLRYSK